MTGVAQRADHQWEFGSDPVHFVQRIPAASPRFTTKTMLNEPPVQGTSELSWLLSWIRSYADDAALPLLIGVGRHQFLSAVSRLLNLRDGWNGRNAPAPTKKVIAKTLAIAVLSAQAGYPADRVVPDVEGGIAIYFFGGARMDDGGRSRQGGILAYNDDDEMVLYLRDRTKPGREIKSFRPTATNIRDALDRVRSYTVGS